jgi:hypothetical protein
VFRVYSLGYVVFGAMQIEGVLVWPVLRVFSAGLYYGSLLQTPGLVEGVLVWPVRCPGAGFRVGLYKSVLLFRLSGWGEWLG